MSYATFADVVSRYKPIQTMVGSDSSTYVTTAEVASVYIWQSESYVDAFLGMRYPVPLATVPPLITQVTADLALFHLMVEKLPQVPDFMEKRKDRCDEILRSLRDGRMVLPNISTVNSQGDNFAWSSTQDFHPAFDPILRDIDQRADQSEIEQAQNDRSADPGINVDESINEWP